MPKCCWCVNTLLNTVYLLKSSIPLQQIDIDSKFRFCYPDGYWFRLIDASIFGADADAGTQFTIFDLSALEKQLITFIIQHLNN